MSIPLHSEYHPTTSQLAQVFRDEVALLGGNVTDILVEDRWLIGRAVLPTQADVRPNDSINAGVAIRAAGAEVVVHPYTLRQICTNGAVAPHTLASLRVERVAEVNVWNADVDLMLDEVAEAIRACAAPDVFEQNARDMRYATDVEANMALQLLPFVATYPGWISQQLLLIVRRFEESADRSAFGLMNAVTSVARDARDPEVRWSLEELGGGIPARLRGAPEASPRRSGAPSGI